MCMDRKNIARFPTIKVDKRVVAVVKLNYLTNPISLYQNGETPQSPFGSCYSAKIRIMRPLIINIIELLRKPLWLVTLLFGSNAVSCKQQVKKVKKNWGEFEFQWVNQISIMQYLWVITVFLCSPWVAAAFVNKDKKGPFALWGAARRLFADTFQKKLQTF